MYCPRCGVSNEEGMSFCSRCGSPLGQPQPVQMTPPPTQAHDQKKMMLIIVAIVIAAVVIVAVIAAILLMSNESPSNLEITNWDHLGVLSATTFTVQVTNHASTPQTGTIVCTSTFSDGSSYSNTQEITLNGGESGTYYVVVMPTLGSHLLDSPTDWSVHLA